MYSRTVKALRLCTDRTAHRRSRVIVLLFLTTALEGGEGVSVTPRPLFTPEKEPVPILQEAGWAPGPIWAGILVQALRPCTGRTARSWSRGVHLLFLDYGTSRWCGSSVTIRPLFTPGKDPLPNVQEAGRAPGPIWTVAENLASTGIRSRTVQPVASHYTDRATEAHAVL